MKRLLPLLFILMILYWSCEEEVEKDTTPPTVTITSHESGQSVSEIITITATSEDDDGVSKVEFYIENILVLTDTESPYEYQWNTTLYDDGSDHVVKVISYDNSDNSTEVVIVLKVDNSTASPQGGNITSVTYDLESMTVTWEASADEDFKNYKVLYSNTEDGEKDTIGTYTDKTITSHSITEFDPFVENWFWVKVMDTLGFNSIGIGMTNSLESEPNPVNVESVEYDTTQMTIRWGESPDNDFKNYKVLYSNTESGDKDTLATYTNKSTTSYSITDFDPNVENWYWVKVSDVWGLTSTGTGMTNSLNSEPNPVNVESVEYDTTQMTIRWGTSPDSDFKHYNLLYSATENGDRTSVTTITGNSTTSYSITDFDPNVENWYWVEVSDVWGLTSTGTGWTNSLNDEPNSVNVTSVTYDLESMTITWEEYVPNMNRIKQMNQNTRSSVTNDFVSFELLKSDSWDGTYSSVVVITDQTTTSHTLTEYNPLVENWFKVKVTDYWGLNSTGGMLTNEIDSPPNSSEIDSIIYENGSFIITWSQNDDDDFQSYTLHESYSEDMSGYTEIFATDDQTVTSHTISDVDEEIIRYYQIVTMDYWELQSTSNIQEGNTYIRFAQTFGGSDADVGYSVQQTTDGGYIIVGTWLIKTDSNGNVEWINESISGTSGQQTTDGGYIIIGNGELIKTDSNGNEQWINESNGSQVQQTTDGGYVILGSTSIVKLDSNGEWEWDTWADPGVGCGFLCNNSQAIQQTSDDGYIQIYTDYHNPMNNWGHYDVFLTKRDSQGQVEWYYNLGSPLYYDYGYSVDQTEDDGYIITGLMGDDVFLIKTDSQGQEEWYQTFGGNGYYWGNFVQQTSDDGYIITGVANYYNSDGESGILLIKTDPEGNTVPYGD